jgi:probable DNA metabolism protein
MAMQTVTLSGDTDWPGFRREARALLARQVPPEAVAWEARAGAMDGPSIAAASSAAVAAWGRARTPAPSGGAAAIVPPAFVRLCETVVLHGDPARFGLLYRLLWRLVHEPALRRDPLDPDRVRALHMAQAVRRDVHRMKAFMRFRPLAQGEGQPSLHLAWFEPDHHIVEAVAPFLARRLAPMRWAVLTPQRSVRWTPEREFEFGPGTSRRDALPPESGDALWLACYRHVFVQTRFDRAAMDGDGGRSAMDMVCGKPD